MNDPAHPLTSGQFFNDAPATVDNEAVCAASGWFAEQSLDVESSHTMAPGADILFVGAQDCFDNSLLAALNTAVTSGASVVSDSWGTWPATCWSTPPRRPPSTTRSCWPTPPASACCSPPATTATTSPTSA